MTDKDQSAAAERSYPGSSDAFRTIKLWFEQQIENAKQDQISGFAECSERGTIRGEKAHSRHCAMFEALQMFLSEFGTFTDAQRPADCGDPKPDGNPDKCAECGIPRAEHSYNGACYGLCGKFVSPLSSHHSNPEAR